MACSTASHQMLLPKDIRILAICRLVFYTILWLFHPLSPLYYTPKLHWARSHFQSWAKYFNLTYLFLIHFFHLLKSYLDKRWIHLPKTYSSCNLSWFNFVFFVVFCWFAYKQSFFFVFFFRILAYQQYYGKYR